ncbi:hypothetical protein AVEN_167962-1 [Araneus ventricosus]|uniref:Uncharacterized protein n=1 Tax=Araneus ventricosus TaxID=182803 RepID=A0A4Y2XDQ5_ARAVE|nr:hypothetical protein AVEN_167962-1 [Araneus ventricosus]
MAPEQTSLPNPAPATTYPYSHPYQATSFISTRRRLDHPGSPLTPIRYPSRRHPERRTLLPSPSDLMHRSTRRRLDHPGSPLTPMAPEQAVSHPYREWGPSQFTTHPYEAPEQAASHTPIRNGVHPSSPRVHRSGATGS